MNERVAESLRVTRARTELLELNQRFWNGDLVGKGFYSQLGLKGCDYRRSVLIELAPDGGGTWIGRVMGPGGKVLYFDVVIGLSEASKWTDVSQEFRAGLARKRRMRPWDRDVLADELFRSLPTATTKDHSRA